MCSIEQRRVCLQSNQYKSSLSGIYLFQFQRIEERTASSILHRKLFELFSHATDCIVYTRHYKNFTNLKLFHVWSVYNVWDIVSDRIVIIPYSVDIINIRLLWVSKEFPLDFFFHFSIPNNTIDQSIRYLVREVFDFIFLLLVLWLHSFAWTFWLLARWLWLICLLCERTFSLIRYC